MVKNMTYTLCELRKKEVIDVCDGARLGFPEDVAIDGCGNVVYLNIGGGGFRLPFGKSDCRQIPWKDITRITEETIWVKSGSHQ